MAMVVGRWKMRLVESKAQLLYPDMSAELRSVFPR